MTRHNSKDDYNKKETNKETDKEIGELVAALPSHDRYPSRQDWINACWEKVSKSKTFFNLLITPHERQKIATRAAVGKYLYSGKGIRQTARDLQLSLQTINAIKKAISENSYQSYREWSKTKRQKRKYSQNPNSKQVWAEPIGKRTKYGIVRFPSLS